MKYVLIGYGRMGRAIEEQANRRGHARALVIDPAAGSDGAPGALDERALAGAELAFEFTQPQHAEANVAAAVRCGVAVVCGTTGWSPSAALGDAIADRDGRILIAPNFSVGMNLFYRVVADAARRFGAIGLHDPYVLEAHHRGKLDAPSGTAERLARIVLESDKRKTTVQRGNPRGAIEAEALHVASVRAGFEPGTHVVGFDGEFDAIRLEHRARGRAAFAVGAVLAAEWLLEQPRTGLFGFDEVLDGLIARSGGGAGE